LVTNGGLLPEEPEHLERSDGLLLHGESEELDFFLSLVGHSVANYRRPSHSKHLNAALVRENPVLRVTDLLALLNPHFPPA